MSNTGGIQAAVKNSIISIRLDKDKDGNTAVRQTIASVSRCELGDALSKKSLMMINFDEPATMTANK